MSCVQSLTWTVPIPIRSLPSKYSTLGFMWSALLNMFRWFCVNRKHLRLNPSLLCSSNTPSMAPLVSSRFLKPLPTSPRYIRKCTARFRSVLIYSNQILESLTLFQGISSLRRRTCMLSFEKHTQLLQEKLFSASTIQFLVLLMKFGIYFHPLQSHILTL
jgi:hypothetical protein